MQEILDLILSNIECCFSGLGAGLVILAISWFLDRKKKNNISSQIIEKESSGIQAKGSVNINSKVSSSTTQSNSEIQQAIRENSTGIQSGGNININDSDDS
ncbi:MAG: hypothetical protein JNK81_06915 [Anaerolineales bacterium]|nr:hypothetical protein [Anaerolineales bacterium]